MLDQHLSTPLLSVTVTNYNYARFLEANIDSILRQTFTDFELIVIDNASEDNSGEIIEEYSRRDARIRSVVHSMNIGSHASLRESCDLCRGRYRVHVDADDWILDDSAFQQQVELLESNPRVTFVYSRMTLTGPHGESVHTSRPYRTDIVLPGALALEEILGFNITHSGMMFRLDAYEQSGGYPAGYKHADDMLLAVRLAELGDVAYIDQELYAFRQHGSNIHFDPDLVMVRTEILPIIDLAFGGPLGKEVPHASRVRRRVTGRALVHGATQNIFSGRLRTGWSLYWRSARLRPITTIFQRRTLSLLARTVLGSRGFALVRQVIGRRSRRSADRVPTRHRA